MTHFSKMEPNRARHRVTVGNGDPGVGQGDYLALQGSEVIMPLMSVVVDYPYILGEPADLAVLDYPMDFAGITGGLVSGHETLARSLEDGECG